MGADNENGDEGEAALVATLEAGVRPVLKLLDLSSECDVVVWCMAAGV